MAKAGNFVSPKNFNSIFNPCHPVAKAKTLRLLSQSHNYNNVTASNKRKDNLHSPLIGKNTSRGARRLITISTGDGKWHGDWTCDYLLSLQDLQLEDLIEVDDDPHKNAQVCIKLTVQKHASFGLSVEGRIMTSFTRKCSNCSSPYCRQVIYVKPGYEVDLDPLVQDTLRLTTSVKDSCSELCEKSDATVLWTAGQSKASVDKRWSRLLQLRRAK